MRRIWLLPIEPLQERYSDQWLRWFPAELRALGHDVEVVKGDRLSQRIERGQFLDVFDTHYFKATQLARMAEEFRGGAVEAGDVVVLLDAWSPAVTSLAYMRDVSGIDVKLVGLLHAGTWDPHDHLAQKGLGRWAEDVERGWLKALDAVCVATEFHRWMLVSARGAQPTKTHVTGFPLYAREWQPHHGKPWAERGRVVVFPHRLAPEKDPEQFNLLRLAYRDRFGDDGTEWVRSKDVCKTKADYYSLLGRSRVAVSTAKQETWGIAMLESVSLGCWPVTPARLSYPETMHGFDRYASISGAAALVKFGLDAPAAAPWDGTRWEEAISRISQVAESV